MKITNQNFQESDFNHKVYKNNNQFNKSKSTHKSRINKSNYSSNYNTNNNSQTDKYWINRKQIWNEKMNRIKYENELKESQEMRDRPLINKKSSELTKSFSNFVFTENVFERLSMSSSKLYNLESSKTKKSKSPKSKYYFKLNAVSDSDYESFSYSNSKNSNRISSKRKIDNLINFYNKNAFDKSKLFKPKSNKKIINRKLNGHCYQTDTFWSVKNENECIRYNNNSSIKEIVDNLRNHKLEIYMKMKEGKINYDFNNSKSFKNKISKRNNRSKRMSKKENKSKLKFIEIDNKKLFKESKIGTQRSISKKSKESNSKSINSNFSSDVKHENNFKNFNYIEENELERKNLNNYQINDNQYISQNYYDNEYDNNDSEYEILHKNAFNPDYSNKIYSTNKLLKSKVNLIKSYSEKVEGLSSYFINNELKNNFMKEKNNDNYEILYRDDQDNVFKVKKINNFDINKFKFKYNAFDRINKKTNENHNKINNNNNMEDNKLNKNFMLKHQNKISENKKSEIRGNSKISKKSKKSKKSDKSQKRKNSKDDLMKVRRKLHHYLSVK